MPRRSARPMAPCGRCIAEFAFIAVVAMIDGGTNEMRDRDGR